jgi:hypothetical protein
LGWEWKLRGEIAEVSSNDWKRPRKGQGYRGSWFGCRRRSGNLRRRNHRHPDRYNDWRIHSGVDDIGYACRRLVAARLGLARMGLAPWTVLAPRLVLISTQ